MVEPPIQQIYITLPYIKGITEQLTRTLRQHDITATSKPLKTLQRHSPSPKHRVEPCKQTNVVYKITVWRVQLVIYRRNGEGIRNDKKRTYEKCKNTRDLFKHSITFMEERSQD